MSNSLSLDEAVEKAREVIEKRGALRFSGRCGVGKTTLCRRILTGTPKSAERVRNGEAFIVAPWSREFADLASYEVLKEVLPPEKGIYAKESRPVKTPDALAFAILKETEEGVRLLDATTQAKLVSEVLQKHVQYDDKCKLCRELKSYLETSNAEVPGTTDERFRKVFLAPGFITKLRETFARFSELGIDIEEDMKRYVALIPGAESERKARAGLSWDVVQGLRMEYAERIKNEYPGFYDNSYMLIECRKQVKAETLKRDQLPKFIVVDDCQDLNLATFYLLKELHLKGVAVIFVGNDDESVQSYKGAFPDVLSILEKGRGFECPSYSLESGYGKEAETEFLCNVAKNIGSWFEIGPIPERAGKPLVSPSLEKSDYFECRIAKSEEEELDFLEHEIMGYMLSREKGKKSWGDLAVIANNNTFLRKVGKRLMADRVPFRYTTVGDEALKDSYVVKGMLALMKLSYYAAHSAEKETLKQMCKDSYTLVVDALKSPLLASPQENTAADLFIAIRALQCILSPLAPSEQGCEKEGYDKTLEAFPEFRSWAELKEKEFEDKDLNSFFAFLLAYPREREDILGNLFGDRKEKKRGRLSVRGWMFNNLFELLRTAKQSSDDIPELFCKLWEGCGKAHPWDRDSWQKLALEGGAKSDEINLWLDQLIRLQHLADTAPDGEKVPEFCERVSKAYIESDSLASVAPKNNKVTLSSPSGAQSKHYKKVWVADLQEARWNKPATENSDLFLTRLLEAVVTAKEVEEDSPKYLPSEEGASFQSRSAIRERCSNLRTFLVAATRACSDPDGKTTFVALDNDERAPYRILKVFQDSPGAWGECRIKLPEQELRYNTLKGLADYCRLKLAEEEKEGEEGDEALDAAHALNFLASKAKVKSADPSCWNFMGQPPLAGNLEEEREIKIGPSQVEGIWKDTMEQVLRDRSYAGPTKSIPQARFGTNIHECAQQITDAYGAHPEALANEYGNNPEELSERLMGSFRELQKKDLELSPLERSSFERRAQKAMDNLASYLIDVSDPSNPDGLEEAFAERRFEARFTLEEVFRIAKNTEGLEGITLPEFIEALEVLGNFDGLSSIEHATVCLSGKLDRIERRKDGIYVVDYKTGKKHFDGPANVSDLQLLCYQLLLHFNKKGEDPRFEGRDVQKSMIFSLEWEAYPATDKDKDEAKPDKRGFYFQPCIFGQGGGLNAGFVKAEKVKGYMPKRPDGADISNRLVQIIQNQLPEEIKGNKSLNILPWVLYMLSKFFYAVRYIYADQLPMREIKGGKEIDDHIVERAMTIYGMCEKKSGKEEN
ncbi:MAG: ATP-dependent helicase [Aeriscardovia sp.]|nr:ATP-dependent helicase [Aeriscardovia sp.]